MGASPKACVESALQAMGGRERIAAIENLHLDEIGHTLLMEQSYRQDPFITCYERSHETRGFKRLSLQAGRLALRLARPRLGRRRPDPQSSAAAARRFLRTRPAFRADHHAPLLAGGRARGCPFARAISVGGKVSRGSSANRMGLYPLRGASTERQYMVYFPEHRLLYASDTLALNDDGSLYDPELMRKWPPP